MQTEVGEASEPATPGRGGSSTMPHKRNPVGSAVVLAAAARVPGLVSIMLAAMVQEHERGLGGWHAEWETLPEICTLSAGALAQTIVIVEGIEVDPARMAANLDLSGGLILAEAVTMALGAKLGTHEGPSAARGCVSDGRYARASTCAKCSRPMRSVTSASVGRGPRSFARPEALHRTGRAHGGARARRAREGER